MNTINPQIHRSTQKNLKTTEPRNIVISDKERNLKQPENKRCITSKGTKISMTADFLVRNNANKKAVEQYLLSIERK